MTQLHKDGSHVVNHKLGENLHWMHGLDEYLTYINHPELATYKKIYNAILHGNIWNIKELVTSEIYRGHTDLTDEFLNILLSHYTGYQHINHRKVLQYVAHCVDCDYIRKISSWSIKWQNLANLNDHFSRGQMKSKCWMVEQLNLIFDQKYLGTVVHYGGWYATVAKNLFNDFKIKNYYNIELDQECIEIADNFNYEQANGWRFKSVHKDCSDIRYDKNNSFTVKIKNRMGNQITTNIIPNLIINTSCEHMNEDWFHNLPTGTPICLQTNNYFDNEQHINCVAGVDEALEKYPMGEVFYSGEIETHLYNRYMIIGRK